MAVYAKHSKMYTEPRHNPIVRVAVSLAKTIEKYTDSRTVARANPVLIPVSRNARFFLKE